MDRNATGASSAPLERQLSHLKLVSRLLAHELSSQSGPRLTLSREEVIEVQTSLDLFIEEALRTRSSLSHDTEPVAMRVN